MITSITKRFTFEASHFLPNHEGKCRNLHGHSYKLEVTVTGRTNKDIKSPEYGMVVDFGYLSDVVESIIAPLDHCTLNDFYTNPTAEYMAQDLFVRFNSEFSEKECDVTSVKLWETEKCYVEVKAE